MNDRQKTIVESLRQLNYSYAFIARQLGLSTNTVKSFCRRNNIRPITHQRKRKNEKQGRQFCKYCGASIAGSPEPNRVFCSRECQQNYWKERRHMNSK